MFSYPVSERQEVDKARNGRYDLHDDPDDVWRRLGNLRTQQPILQRVRVRNPLKRKNQSVFLDSEIQRLLLSLDRRLI